MVAMSKALIALIQKEPTMTDPTPSVSEALLDDFGRNCRADGYAHVENTPGTRRAWEAIRAHIADLEAQLAADPCVRHSCRRVRLEMQGQIDAARRDAERLRSLLRVGVGALRAALGRIRPLGQTAQFLADADAAMGATHEG